MKNTGITYEQFVQQLYKKLQQLNYENYQNIEIKHNEKIIDKNSIERQFDIYWKYEYLGIEYETVIECKDYASDISIDKIDAFIGKIQDIPNLRGIFATRSGYQSGAETKAKCNGIELYVIREQNDTDWVDNEGNDFIKTIVTSFEIKIPLRIERVIITSKDFHEKQVEVTTKDVHIKDLKLNKVYSFDDVINDLEQKHEGNYGEFTEKTEFENALIITPQGEFKLDAYEIIYNIPRNAQLIIENDFSKNIMGVIENISKNSKTVIGKDKIFNH